MKQSLATFEYYSMTSIETIPEKEGPAPQYPVLDIISKRWSPRAFGSTDISDEELNQLFEAMRWAPSSMNAQPWRMLYARKGEDAFGKIHESLVEGNKSWAINAPVLILAMVKNTLDDGSPNSSAVHDLGLAVGNLLVQATSMGLAVHQMGGFSREKAATLFKLPEDYAPNTVLALGHFGNPDSLSERLKDREIKPRSRKKIEEFIFHGLIK